MYSESDDSFDALIFNLFENSERRKEETRKRREKGNKEKPKRGERIRNKKMKLER